MFDQLAGLFQPQQAAPAQPDPNLKAEWDGFLSNPKNRAGILSFGLGLMQPTWGNSFANALGAGAEAYGAVEKIQQDEAVRQGNIGRATSEKEKDRQLTRDMNKEDNESAMARTKYSADATISRAGIANAAKWSRGANALFEKVYKQKLDSLLKPDIVTFDPKAPPLTEEEMNMKAAQAAAAAADAFDARFGTSGTGQGTDAGASNSQKSGSAVEGGDSGPAGEGAPAANVGAGNNSTKTQSDITINEFVSKASPEKLDALLARPDADALFGKYGWNAAMVRQKRAQKDAMNWLQGLTMPKVGQTPGVATPGVRGPGTGQVK